MGGLVVVLHGEVIGEIATGGDELRFTYGAGDAAAAVDAAAGSRASRRADRAVVGGIDTA